MVTEINFLFTGFLAVMCVLTALTIYSMARHKKNGTSIWESPPRKPGVHRNWRLLAIGLGLLAVFSGGRFLPFVDEVKFTTIDANGSVNHHVLELPHNGALVKARFVLPDGTPAIGGLAHVYYRSPRPEGANKFQQLAAADANGNVVVTHFEHWISTLKVNETTPYTLEFVYKDELNNTMFVYQDQFDAEGKRLVDLGDIQLGNRGHDLTFNLYLHGEPYTGRARFKTWDYSSSLAVQLTGRGNSYRIVGVPTVEEGGPSQYSFHVELLDAQYKHGKNVERSITVQAGELLERKAVINENFRID